MPRTSPDFVFRAAQVTVFVDGNFWHGWRLPAWHHKLSKFWQAKLSGNRARDLRNQAKLRRLGWTVIRLWEHQVEGDLPACAAKIQKALTLQLLLWEMSESMGNHDSEVVDASSVD